VLEFSMSLSYAAPASLGEALALLAERGPESIVLAGGMSVVPALKKSLPARKILVNIKGIGAAPAPALDAAARHLMIGALVRHREVETSPLVAEHFPALKALEEKLASVQIRNHGTLAGNLCAAEPWSDPPCLLAALDARLHVVAQRAERRVPATDWITGIEATQRAPDELVLAIELPLLMSRVGVGHARVAARQGLARPLACAAARIGLSDNGNIAAARVFVGAVGPRPQRMTEVEAMLVGRAFSSAMSGEIERAAARAAEYLADPRCGRQYKTQVAGVLVRRAIADAVENANTRAT
jgi:carbon-monoxide dehydrogenase medium subunit